MSPDAGYTQEDVIDLSYIMAGWEHEWKKRVKNVIPCASIRKATARDAYCSRQILQAARTKLLKQINGCD